MLTANAAFSILIITIPLNNNNSGNDPQSPANVFLPCWQAEYSRQDFDLLQEANGLAFCLISRNTAAVLPHLLSGEDERHRTWDIFWTCFLTGFWAQASQICARTSCIHISSKTLQKYWFLIPTGPMRALPIAQCCCNWDRVPFYPENNWYIQTA